MKYSFRADIALILVTFFWGIGFPAVKFTLESIGPLYLIAVRFLIAGLLLSIIFYKKMLSIDKSILKPAFWLSILIYITYVFAMVGIKYTTASKSAFLCCLALIFVPIIGYILNRTRIKSNTAVGILICVIGLFLMTYAAEGINLNLGDVLCILSSAAFAFQIIFTEKYVSDFDTTLLAILQMYFAAIIGVIVAFIFEPFPVSVTPKSLYSLLFMAVLCTALAFWIQTTCQKFTTASHVAIIFTMEPVFGALASWLLLGERLGARGIIGGVLIIASMIISEIEIPFLNKKIQYPTEL
jgi:drug/metabolite transporter (DMT)-like permease